MEEKDWRDTVTRLRADLKQAVETLRSQHDFHARLHKERDALLLQLSEAERKGRELCEAHGTLLLAVRRALADETCLCPEEAKDCKMAALQALVEVKLTEKRYCEATTSEGFRCSLDHGHEGAHVIKLATTR